jgi:hypothetical protein
MLCSGVPSADECPLRINFVSGDFFISATALSRIENDDVLSTNELNSNWMLSKLKLGFSTGAGASSFSGTGAGFFSSTGGAGFSTGAGAGFAASFFVLQEYMVSVNKARSVVNKRFLVMFMF